MPGRSAGPSVRYSAWSACTTAASTGSPRWYGVKPRPRELLVGVQRVVHERHGAARVERLDGAEDARERGLLHAAAVGGAEHDDPRAGEVAVGALEQADRVVGHAGVGGAGRRDDGRLGVGPQVQPRVHRDAVAADGDAGLVDVAVRLRVRCLDHLVDVDARGRGVAGELVREADVHVAVGGLGELGQLGGLGGAEVPDAVRARAGRGARRSRAPPRRTRRPARRRARERPPTSFGYLRRSAKTRPVSTRSGEKTRSKSTPSVRPEASSSSGFQRVRVVPTGSVVS